MNGNNGDIEILMFPGWGFNADSWKIWDAFLEPDYKLKKFEPGYFGSERRVKFSGLHNRLNVIFAHSFGLHQCSPEQLRRADLLVIFSGFIHFHPRAKQYRRRSRLVVHQMINKLEEYPRKVLEDFMDNCYHPEPADPSIPKNSINKQRLLSDLKCLNSEQLNVELLNYIPSICILHGREDAIVPNKKGRELYESISVQGHYYEIHQAGHALPFTHTQMCWSFIKPIIENFD